MRIYDIVKHYLESTPRTDVLPSSLYYSIFSMIPQIGGESRYVIMFVMLATGALSTLLWKYVSGIAASPLGPGMPPTGFEHPFLLALLCGQGNSLCLLVFSWRTSKTTKQDDEQSFPLISCIVPALCDLTATTLIYTAFILLPASVLQMCKGSMVLFTFLLSKIVLGTRQRGFQIAGLTLVVLGIVVVSLSLFGRGSSKGEEPMRFGYVSSHIGLALCLVSQLFRAVALVLEERILHTYGASPLHLLGVMGCFNASFGTVILCVLAGCGIVDMPGALYQIDHSMQLFSAVSLAILVSVVFTWSGLVVTSRDTCIARTTIDVSRSLVVWIVELALAWNTFAPLQLLGFILLAIGTILFNRVVEFPYLFQYSTTKAEMSTLL